MKKEKAKTCPACSMILYENREHECRTDNLLVSISLQLSQISKCLGDVVKILRNKVGKE